MDSEAPAFQISEDVKRNLAVYHPTVWGDRFLNYTSQSTVMGTETEEIQELKQAVRKSLADTVKTSSQKLDLIDTIQRLGIAYHFKKEIDEELAQSLNAWKTHRNRSDNDFTDTDLRTISLQFRLLRQEGYNVSSDIFNKFKDRNGSFKKEIVKDVKGMLSLYEASHMSTHGEDILDEALTFTTAHLETIAANLSPLLANQVKHALKRPLRKSLIRQEALYYISVYEQDDQLHSTTLLKLAKLDFNAVQKLHQQELSSITRWWKELDFASKLPFARDRVIECYFWPLGINFGPQFAFGRNMLTKTIAIFSAIDDIYDAYGTLGELELFTEAIQRFDASMYDQLPNYMKVTYKALTDMYSEFEADMAKEGRQFCISYAKEATKKLARAYLLEARWMHANHVPSVEEYISNGLVTSVYPLLITISFSGMGEIASKEAFDFLFAEPNKIVNAASAVCRLMDDIVSHKFEQSRAHVASAVECYMKQYEISNYQAYKEINKIVANAWKDINEELLKPTKIPMPLLTCIRYFACIIDVVYKDEDAYTHSKTTMKEILATLLLKPVAF